MMPGGRTAIGNMAFSEQPQSVLDVEGNLTVGANYAGTNAAPANGAIIEGNVGIGTTTPVDRFHVLKTGSTTGGMVLGGGNVTGSETKFLGFGTAHMSIYNSGSNALTFANTSALAKQILLVPL